MPFVDHSLRAIQGEPSKHLTYVVSLMRGAAFEWYSSLEMRSGCLGDWTMLHQAMLEHFGLSICAKKARAVLLQTTQDKMIVLQYASAFESYLAQLEHYNESLYSTKFIFGLRFFLRFLYGVQQLCWKLKGLQKNWNYLIQW